MGFAWSAKWSEALSCSCSGCTTPTGKSRGRLAEIERGNALVPAQALLLYRQLISTMVAMESGAELGNMAVWTGCADDPDACDDAVVEAHGGEGVHEPQGEGASDKAAGGEDDEVITTARDSGDLTLSAATSLVTRLHNVLGHRSLDKIQAELRSGAMVGPFVSDEQFAAIKKGFRCATCTKALSVFSTKGHLHPWGAPKRTPTRVLEVVSVDMSGKQAEQSQVYIGDRGNQKGGGNNYFVLFRDVYRRLRRNLHLLLR